MNHSAFMIIDMLNDFIDPKGILFCGPSARDIISPISQTLEGNRKISAPIFFLQDSHDENDAEFERFPPHCVTGTWGGDIITELTPKPGEIVVHKKRFSGFYRTNLESLLAESNTDSVRVAGVCTSICVMDTIGGLVNRGYEVTVSKQEVADFDPEMHAYSLKRMEKIYGAKII
jgi:nicotinamidase-related amidase